MSESNPKVARWRDELWEVIFEADTTGGKTFDLALLLAIVLSIVAVSLDSVTSIHARYGSELRHTTGHNRFRAAVPQMLYESLLGSASLAISG